MKNSSTVTLKGIIRRNLNDGDMILLQPEDRSITLGKATARLNRLTNDWIIDGQKDGGVYIVKGEKQAALLLRTVDHYNNTGELVTFRKVEIEWTKETR